MATGTGIRRVASIRSRTAATTLSTWPPGSHPRELTRGLPPGCQSDTVHSAAALTVRCCWLGCLIRAGAFASDSTVHIAADMALLKEHCVDGIIFDFQNPTSANDPSKRAIAASFPLVLQAAVANGLAWAVMYDTSSQAGGNWGRGDPTVAADWAEIMQTASDFRDSTLKDAAGNAMFFAFGATPLPEADARCGNCSFYAQDGRIDTGIASAPGQHGAFAWIEPKASSQYLPAFYEAKCAKAFPLAPTPCVGVAYAGFKAVYPDYGTIARSTELLRSTLELCGDNVDLCQIATCKYCESAAAVFNSAHRL
jgi:hypothetical protein